MAKCLIFPLDCGSYIVCCFYILPCHILDLGPVTCSSHGYHKDLCEPILDSFTLFLPLLVLITKLIKLRFTMQHWVEIMCFVSIDILSLVYTSYEINTKEIYINPHIKYIELHIKQLIKSIWKI